MARRPPQPPVNIGTPANALLWLLTLPALSAIVFTRRRFGFRAVMPLKFALIFLVAMMAHDLAADTHNQPELLSGASLTLRYLEVMMAVALWRFIEALWAYWRGAPRHTQYWGDPLLCVLRLPYRLASVIDCFLIFGAGYVIRPYDHFLGPWLMWGAFGLTMVTALGWATQAEDAENLHNTRIYTEMLQERVERRTRTRTASPLQEDDEEVSTGPGRRR